MISPICEKMFSVWSKYHSANKRAGERQRHRQQDDERIDEALELRREHQVDEQQREREHPAERRGALLEVARGAGQRGREALVECRGGNLPEGGDAFGAGCGRAPACRTRSRPSSGCSDTAPAANCSPLNETRLSSRTISVPPSAAHRDVAEIVGPRSKIAGQLADDVVLLAVVNEIAEALSRSATPAGSARCRAR